MTSPRKDFPKDVKHGAPAPGESRFPDRRRASPGSGADTLGPPTNQKVFTPHHDSCVHIWLCGVLAVDDATWSRGRGWACQRARPPPLDSRNANAIQYWRVQGSPGERVVSRPHRRSRRVLRRGPGGDSRAPLLGCSRPGRHDAGLRSHLCGRYLLVVVIPEGREAFVVTARDMTEAEKNTFRRKAQ
jgi:hypothetical protein